MKGKNGDNEDVNGRSCYLYKSNYWTVDECPKRDVRSINSRWGPATKAKTCKVMNAVGGVLLKMLKSIMIANHNLTFGNAVQRANASD